MKIISIMFQEKLTFLQNFPAAAVLRLLQEGKSITYHAALKKSKNVSTYIMH